MRRSTKHELRCFCKRTPLLAIYGVDEKNNLYVHVKIYKQQRIYGEVLVTAGTVVLHCRECFRWHKVVLRTKDRAELVEEPHPPRLPAKP